MTLEEVQQIIPESEAWKLQPGTYIISYAYGKVPQSGIQRIAEWLKARGVDALFIGIGLDGGLTFHKIGEQ